MCCLILPSLISTEYLAVKSRVEEHEEPAMSSSSENKVPSGDPELPPVPGSYGDLLALYPFPASYPPEVAQTIDPWFLQFESKNPQQVLELLDREWQEIRPPSLKNFTANLLQHHPIGLLHSRMPDEDIAAWIVISKQPASDALKESITNGEAGSGVYYLPPPFQVPDDVNVDKEDLRLNFFLRFGGLRHSPPFQSGHFHRIPTGPTLLDANEQLPGGQEWSDAASLYISDTGDELLLAASGKVGRLLHEDRTIIPAFESLDHLLESMGRGNGLSAYRK